MSKAFTRESDDAPDLPVRKSVSPVPLGSKNYLSPEGAVRLRCELNRLLELERPKLAERGEDPDAKREIRTLDARVVQLQNSLRTAVVVPPPPSPAGPVQFGATVTVRQQDGEIVRYRIVGVDETDVERGWISWISPMAKALLNSSVGAKVRCQKPSDNEDVEILEVTYETTEASF